jgi:hypothetical protein
VESGKLLTARKNSALTIEGGRNSSKSRAQTPQNYERSPIAQVFHPGCGQFGLADLRECNNLQALHCAKLGISKILVMRAGILRADRFFDE